MVDTQRYLSELVGLIRQGQQVTIPVAGSSMTPFLADGRDRVLLRLPDSPLKRGDIALFRRQSGSYILHRVCRTDSDGNYYFAGDAQRSVEGPVPAGRTVAVAIRAERKGRWIGPGSFWWEFFATVWLTLLPLRPLLLKIYGMFRRFGKGGSSDG